jgi:hypothetical protein
MAVQIMPDPSRHPCGAAGPMQGTPGAIPGYIAYFGGYKVDERAKTVAHHRAGNVTPGEARTVVIGYWCKAPAAWPCSPYSSPSPWAQRSCS